MDIKELKRRAGIKIKEGRDDWLSPYMDIQRIAKITNFKPPAGFWELYTNQSGWKRAEQTLNRAFVKLVNSGASKEEVGNAMYEVQSKFSDFGATDTEPSYKLSALIRYVFGDDGDDW